MYKIYKITCLINDKCYIGQTSQTLEARMLKHRSNIKTGKTKLNIAMREFGYEHFTIELIETCHTAVEANEREVFWIHYFHSNENGYNTKSTLGKSGGDTYSDLSSADLGSIKEKIRRSKLGSKNPNARSIIVKNLETNEELCFNSVIEAQEKLNIPRHDIIIRRCQGKIKKPWNSWMFFYK